jgi:hypothetical protein
MNVSLLVSVAGSSPAFLPTMPAAIVLDRPASANDKHLVPRQQGILLLSVFMLE